ncbi:MAG TPA: hypothetical protein VIS48_08450 [Candidatus Kryptonia bacterium]
MKHMIRSSALAATIINLIMFSFGVEASYSQVSVAPSSVFIHGKGGIGNLYITNNSSTPQEISIDFTFGYPGADSAGNPVMNYNDTIAAQAYALNPFIKAYPKAFTLNPGEEQTVRFQVRTNGSVRNAFYFTRVKVTSNQKSAEIERKQSDSVAAQVRFRFNQILPVFYQKGDVSTGLTIHDVSTLINNDTLEAVADVERTGTAPFIGSVRAELFSPANERVALFESTISIYFRMKDKMELDLSKAGKGPHRLVLTYETKRSDVSAEDLLQTLPVSKEVTVNLP